MCRSWDLVRVNQKGVNATEMRMKIFPFTDGIVLVDNREISVAVLDQFQSALVVKVRSVWNSWGCLQVGSKPVVKVLTVEEL